MPNYFLMKGTTALSDYHTLSPENIVVFNRTHKEAITFLLMLVLALKANCVFHLLSKSIPINDAVNRGPLILHKQQKIMENVNSFQMNVFSIPIFFLSIHESLYAQQETIG